MKNQRSMAVACAGTTRNSMMTMINGGGGGYSHRRISGRLIPKRGQVKLGIVLGLAHSFASIFSLTRKCAVDEEESSYLLSPTGAEEVISDRDADEGGGGGASSAQAELRFVANWTAHVETENE
ncbi:hypothetical protein Dsin_027636 [Dipteronia sinensis]|uniref:Uncharacterized protein n=1 Tax=Dipteronia sinensis TaxID=43782 RepID=A0AAD9ZPS1_9ROSI|nr:hypothetical protein Dsin_027636 [Dipteronia sinensis]